MARLIDLTRTVSRLGRGPMTGIDRVEFAYVARFLAETAPLFGLVRSRLGFVVLDRAGVQAVADRAKGAPLGRAGILGRLLGRGDPLRARAEADVRGLALARAAAPLLRRMLRRRLPGGFDYFNLGHANLSTRALGGVKAAGGRVVVLVHDTIPLDHPAYTRPGIPAVFARKMAAVARHADLVIHSTRDARARTEAHLARFGRCPPGLVANLGIDLALPAPLALPVPLALPTPLARQDRPYLVALGTIEPRKNHALLLDVWAQKTGDATLCIVGGRGWAGPDLFARIAAAADVIEMPGLTDGQVVTLLQGARALLFPSFAEGFGLPPLEAAALGVPVIAADLPVLRELLGDYPVYLDPRDVYSWRQAIDALAAVAKSDAKGLAQVRLPTWDEHFNTVLNSR